MARKPAEESASDEKLDDVLETLGTQEGARNDETDETDETPAESRNLITSDREELIQCIKRGETPTWVSRLEAKPEPPGSQDEAPLPSTGPDDRGNLPTPDILLSSHPIPEPIPRPPSALHSGDFREQSNPPRTHQSSEQSRDQGGLLSTSPPAWSWPRFFPPSSPPRHIEEQEPLLREQRRARAPSLGTSLSSSYVFRAPTSPLVNATNNSSLDLTSMSRLEQRSTSPDKGNRRRTMPPEAFGALNDKLVINYSRPLPTPNIRQEYSLPQQSHQPRRSLNSFTYQPLSNPQSPPPFLRSRRISFAGDSSPIQHAAMVGSFEESILRGRMSTAPSKPLDFVAQIGVFGKGNCKPSLKCPAHVTVSFPAVFYNYPSTGGRRSLADDSPSPYVGTIDLEHNLKPPLQAKSPRRRYPRKAKDGEEMMEEIAAPEHTLIGRALAREAKHSDKSFSPLPLGGCYRVPEQGQLQIVIKNPNKTAVKLFLIPYDLEDMEPGSKTFVRQRSFSAGPILDNPLTENPDAVIGIAPLQDKQVLRYLIHLKFCCPAKGRIYLYDNIRVVFANRVPDGKEKLRNEIQTPAPKYSPYKPDRRSSTGSTEQTDALQKQQRRRSSGFGLTSDFRVALECIALPRTDFQPVPPVPMVPEAAPPPLPTQAPMIESIPISVESAIQALNENKEAQPLSSADFGTPGYDTLFLGRKSPAGWTQPSLGANSRPYSPLPLEAGDGLLSRRLREYDGLVSKGAESSDGGEADMTVAK